MVSHVEPYRPEHLAPVRALINCHLNAAVPGAHLLRYGDHAKVSDVYRAVDEIAWLVAWPSHEQASVELLAAAQAQLAAWEVRTQWAVAGLLVPVLSGVPDAWPHIAAVLTRRASARPRNARRRSMAASLPACRHPRRLRWLGCGCAGWSGISRCGSLRFSRA